MQAIENPGSSRNADLVALSRAFQVCELDVVLVSKQRAEAFVEARTYKETIFCVGEVSFDFRGSFMLPPEWCMLGCIHETAESSWIHGIPLESKTAFTVLPGRPNDFMLAKGSRVTGVLLPFVIMEAKLAELLPYRGEAKRWKSRPFRLSEGADGIALHSDFETIRDHLVRAGRAGNSLADPDVDTDALLTKHLLAGLSSMSHHRLPCSRGRQTHYRIVQRVEQYLRENLHKDIYSAELCAAGCVSERTLRYAFHDLMQISPNRYLSMLRLCKAFQRLASSDAGRCSVKSVALSCGFWDLSRFADQYQQVFHELPHETLMQVPPSEFTARAWRFHP